MSGLICRPYCRQALVVADAGFNGFPLAQAITQAGRSYLIRMSGKDRLYTRESVAVETFCEGEVLLWTAHRNARKGRRCRPD